jgi:hypothetical protein
MSQIVVDAKLQKQIEEATGPIKIVTQSGSTIGMVTPIKFPKSPYSREEIEQARKQCRETGGKPLKEILASLAESQT